MATSTDLRAAISEVHRQLPANTVEPGEPFEFEPDWATRLEQRMGHAPWWAVSTVVHAVIFLLATLLSVALPAANMDEVIITSDVAKEKEPEYDPKKKRDIFKNPQEVKHETQVERPVVIHEERAEAENFETENNANTQTARGSEDAISDIPLGGIGTVASIGVGGGGGMAGVFGYRDGGGRKKATKRFGGSPATESAVEAALQWLKRHQEKEGHWDAGKWMGGTRRFGFGRARRGAKVTAHNRQNISMSGMALLAFLGAGYTEKAGKHKDTVAAAQKWLLETLDARAKAGMKYGTFDACNYTQGMATLAIAEAYGMTKTPELKKAAQAAINVVIASQGPYEAWNYRTKNGKAGRNDTSVSGWNLMALKSAKIAGLKVDGAAFQGCMNWLNASTDKTNGKCSYSGYVGKKSRFRTRLGSGSKAMWAAGMLMRQFMGAKQDDPILQKAADSIAQHQPTWDLTKIPARTIPARTIPARTIPARTYPERKIPARTFGGKTYPARTIPARTIPARTYPARTIPARTIPARSASSTVDFYFWYYATLCMFQMGDKHWNTWNVNMKKALLGHQRKGGPMDGSKKDVDGSWDPTSGGHVSSGGRVFSTALGALTLEVYYRYLPLYAKD